MGPRTAVMAALVAPLVFPPAEARAQLAAQVAPDSPPAQGPLLGAETVPAPPPSRRALDAFGLALEAAVGRVSQPGVLAGTSLPPCRGYHLPGYGVVFVLAPRALPLPAAASEDMEQEAARAFAEVVQGLRQSIQAIGSPEIREQFEQSLRELQEGQAALAALPRLLPRPAIPPTVPQVAPAGPRDQRDAVQEESKRELRAHLLEQIRILQDKDRPYQAADRVRRQRLEAALAALEEHAEAFRRESEQARARAERDVRLHLGLAPAPGEVLEDSPEGAALAVAGAGAPPNPNPNPNLNPAPAPPPNWSAVVTIESVPSEITVAPAPVPAGAAAAPPVVPPALGRPWSLWLQGPAEADADARPPQAVIADVRSAVMRLFETRTTARLVRPEESVVVAVDFVPRGMVAGYGRSQQKTLLLRVRESDLRQRRAGRIGPEEFRRRVEVTEY